MGQIIHNTHGACEIIERIGESKIRIRLGNGQETTLSIPKSFETGIYRAEGDLKDEVEAAIAEREACAAQRLNVAIAKVEAAKAAAEANKQANRQAKSSRRKRKKAPVEDKDPERLAYEQYLIDEDYTQYTPDGYNSTVYAYSGAIERHVLANEGITWIGLRNDIDYIIGKYSVGGPMERVGAISNNTVIDSLKKYRDFVNS